MPTLNQRLTTLFPIVAITASLFAYWQPDFLNDLGHWIVPILMLIMFSMGLTLTLGDFKRVFERKMSVVLGLILQYSVMPLTAFSLASVLGLSQELLIGMVLVGGASGGTASNVICYLARGDVALSISMTLVSTLVAVVALPFLSWLYLGQVVPVPVASMFLSVLKIVLVPLAIGIVLNHFLAHAVNSVKHTLPFITTMAIVIVIAIIVALNHDSFAKVSIALVIAVVLHNLVGLLIGYWGARYCGQDRKTSRTIAIEVGMQNSGLAVALAVKYFSPLAALPGALFSIWHNVSGSIIASVWSRSSQPEEPDHI